MCTSIFLNFFWFVCLYDERKKHFKKVLIVSFVAALNYNFAGKNNRKIIFQKKNLISSSVLLSINFPGQITGGVLNEMTSI